MADKTPYPFGPHMMLRTPAERIKLIDAWVADQPNIYGSDTVNNIAALRARKRGEMFSPGTRIEQTEVSVRDQALMMQAMADISDTTVDYLTSMMEKDIDEMTLKEKIFTAMSDAQVAYADKSTDLTMKLMTEKRTAISDMWTGYKDGIEFSRKLLEGPGGDKITAGDLEQKYQVKLASKFNELYKLHQRERADAQSIVLNSLNADELQKYVDTFGNIDGVPRSSTAALIGHATVAEAAKKITNKTNGVLGTYSMADQRTIEGVRLGQIDLGSTTGASPSIEILDQHARDNLLEGEHVITSRDAANNYIGYLSAAAPDKFTQLMTGMIPDNLGLIPWLEEQGGLSAAKDWSAYISAHSGGELDNSPDLIMAVLGSSGKSDDQIDLEHRMATNVALMHESSLTPGTREVNPTTQMGYDLFTSPFFTQMQARTGKTAKQLMNSMVRDAGKQARAAKRRAVAVRAVEKQALVKSGGHSRDWLAKTWSDVQQEQQDRVQEALANPVVSDSSVLTGDIPLEDPKPPEIKAPPSE